MVSRPTWLTYVVVAAAALVLLLPSAQGLAQSPTPTTLPMANWTGRVVSVTQDLSLRGSVLRVSVAGFKGLPVKVFSGSWNAVGLTGSKPEFGPYVVEFAPIPHGLVVIEPQGLGASVSLNADMTSYITVEFTKGMSDLPVATATGAATSTPWPIVLPTVSSATNTPMPWIIIATDTPAPLSTPSPSPTLQRIVPTPIPTALTLPSPTATASPEPGPAPVTVWQGRVTRRVAGSVFGYGSIVVRVTGMAGLPIEIDNGGYHAVATTGTKPEYGAFAGEFGGLGAGEYRITPRGLGASLAVSIDAGEFALVDFDPTLMAPTPEAVLVPSTTATSSVTATVAAVAAPVAPSTSTPEATLTLSDVVTGNPFYVPVPPVPVWSAHVTQRVSGIANGRLAATIVVRVLGARDLPVIVDSGGWQARALTGSKPEYGEFAVEFGGLPAGEYDVLPEGLKLRYKVSVERGDFIVVDFTYQVPPTPMPLAVTITDTATVSLTAMTAPISLTAVTATGSWSGRVLSRTVSASDTGGLVVLVAGLKSLPVEVKSADGWSVFALADRRDGYPAFAARFERLAPGRYQVVPQGLGTWIELTVTKGSDTWMEFSPD
jgi:hypothetical protein